jgi:hypothetical protein
MANSEVCYGWDAHNKQVLRFQTEYQRSLWIKNGHPDYPEDRQELDPAHYLVRRMTGWEFDAGRGIHIGTAGA